MLSTDCRADGTPDRDPILVVAADDQFAMPLAATVRSVLDNLSASRMLRIYVLDGGLTDESKSRLMRSWPKSRFEIEFINVDASVLAGVPVSGHVNVVSYYRLLIPRVLPEDVERAIYLDSDVIACTDIAPLWDRDLAGCLCLAVRDCATPYFDSTQALANYDLCRPHMGLAQPVPNFRELGLQPDAPYFNAGVLLINLSAWREADICTRSLACLEEHRQHVVFWDQYAMNVVLAGRWGQLEMNWNQGWHAFKYPTWQQSPFDQDTFEQLWKRPYIVHFTTRFKPWHGCVHPYRREFFKYLDRTAWAGWRPPRLKRMMELIKIPERRLRQKRNWLRDQARQWLRRAA
jgi:lipopolysaccharide biosynthesis glycosyltransferase